MNYVGKVRKVPRNDVRSNRENMEVEGFDFDTDTFEDLIDNFVPKDNILKLLNVPLADMNYFCQSCYNCNFSEAYDILIGRADYYDRKAFNNLAQSGNGAAINVVAKYFMKLDDDDKKNELRIEVVNNIPKKEEK